MTIVEHIVGALLDNLDSLEASDRRTHNPGEAAFREQLPRPPAWHPGHRSSRRLLNMNNRRSSFGYTDRDSMRDRGWPIVNRDFDKRKRAYDRKLRRQGEVDDGSGI